LSVCDRRGIDVDTINVFLDNATSPLPLLTTETSWLAGRTIRIRGKIRLFVAVKNKRITEPRDLWPCSVLRP
jgi:hypothetical protein